MWKCPKCGRAFQKEDQSHFCGEADDIGAYIAMQPEQVRPILMRVRELLREAAPDALEKIAWQMPTYWQKENLIHFAAFKKHIGLYPGPEAIEVFAERLKGYKTSKGAIQLPLGAPLDEALILDIARWRVQRVEEGRA